MWIPEPVTSLYGDEGWRLGQIEYSFLPTMDRHSLDRCDNPFSIKLSISPLLQIPLFISLDEELLFSEPCNNILVSPYKYSDDMAYSVIVVTTVNPRKFEGNLFLNSTPATKFYFHTNIAAIEAVTARRQTQKLVFEVELPNLEKQLKDMVKRGKNLKVKLRFPEHKRRDTAGRFEIIFQFPTKLNVKVVAVAATERAKKAFQHNEHLPKRNMEQYSSNGFVGFMPKQETPNARMHGRAPIPIDAIW
ncbi:BnaCnng21520D [Brassica napus]|uniref:(rape) hypothetical protein n=1 Tax=Brassica napus TaxID=3708 RepID=A0A078ISD0_BRANA|nr:unnamed protein product [Brassica napus]CDY51968.1 BnaCnng21520D [Brassica napus]